MDLLVEVGVPFDFGGLLVAKTERNFLAEAKLTLGISTGKLTGQVSVEF